MTVLDILASTEIHSLARGCAFSYRLSHILWGYGGAGRAYRLSGGGLTFEGGLFSGEYGNTSGFCNNSY